jgi:hypothetical protein
VTAYFRPIDRRAWFRAGRSLAVAAGLALVGSGLATPTFALSEIKPDDTPVTEEAQDASPDIGIPAPEPIQKTPLPDPTMTAPEEDVPAPDGASPEEPGEEAEPGDVPAGEGEGNSPPQTGAGEPPAEILYDLSLLPEPVRRMRQLILDATKSGDPEALRSLIGTGDDITQLSLGGLDGDPIEFIKSLSGDEGGQEILAILEEVLTSGFVRLDAGDPEEMYIWPYFFATPLETLTAPQRVELFKILTAGDYEDMKSYGGYIFYRAGITPEGRWSFFVAGD